MLSQKHPQPNSEWISSAVEEKIPTSVFEEKKGGGKHLCFVLEMYRGCIVNVQAGQEPSWTPR